MIGGIDSVFDRSVPRSPPELGLGGSVPRLHSTTKSTPSLDEAVAVNDCFEVFGLPRRFGLELPDLKKTYLVLMTEHHPDKRRHNNNRGGNDENPALAAETITHAYQTLRSPHTRALHWLELHGCALEDAGRDGNTEMLGTDFLAEIMEFREAVEEAGSDPEKLEAITAETRVHHGACLRALGRVLDDDDKEGGHPTEETLREAQKLVAQLMYWHRLEETLKDANDEP